MDNQQTIVYGALAVILLVVLGSAFYTFSQVNALKGQVDGFSSKISSLDSLTAAQQSRIASLETKVGSLDVNAKVILFYDSSCDFCGNEFILQDLEQTQQALASQKIGLQTVDIKDNPNPALASGVKSVPVFFSSKADLASNAKLVDFYNSLPQIRFSVQETSFGAMALPPVTGAVVGAQSCRNDAVVTLSYFYSPTCAFCQPVFYGNGTRYNDPNLTTRFQVLAKDTVANLSASFGSRLQLSEHCAAVHTLEENQVVLNISQSDAQICTQETGKDVFDVDQGLFDSYGLFGAPAFVIDCQYITSARDSAQLTQALCELRPDICALANVTAG